MSDPENGKRARRVSERVSGHSDAYRPLPTSHYVSSARRSKPGIGTAAAAHGAFAAGPARGSAGRDSGGKASSFIMSLLLGQERWARGPCAWHPTCSPSGRATGLSAIGANGSFCRRSFAPLSPGPALPQALPGTAGAAPIPSAKRAAREASQHPPYSGLHSTLHTAGFTAPSAQRAAREASQHPPHSGLYNTLLTAGFTTPSSQRALQHPPHSGLYNTLRTAREASQHPPHSGQQGKLYNTLHTVGSREISQHPPHRQRGVGWGGGLHNSYHYDSRVETTPLLDTACLHLDCSIRNTTLSPNTG